MTYLKLTNALGIHSGNPLLINAASIRSIFPVTRPDGTIVTVLWTSAAENWEVKDSIDEVWQMLVLAKQ